MIFLVTLLVVFTAVERHSRCWPGGDPIDAVSC